MQFTQKTKIVYNISGDEKSATCYRCLNSSTLNVNTDAFLYVDPNHQNMRLSVSSAEERTPDWN
jgi:hypothetical protein